LAILIKKSPNLETHLIWSFKAVLQPVRFSIVRLFFSGFFLFNKSIAHYPSLLQTKTWEGINKILDDIKRFRTLKEQTPTNIAHVFSLCISSVHFQITIDILYAFFSKKIWCFKLLLVSVVLYQLTSKSVLEFNFPNFLQPKLSLFMILTPWFSLNIPTKRMWSEFILKYFLKVFKIIFQFCMHCQLFMISISLQRN